MHLMTEELCSGVDFGIRRERERERERDGWMDGWMDILID